MRWLERRIMLDIVDTQWKDHLLTLDHLKEGIGLRGYGQKDPLVEFKKEAFTLFEDMMDRIDTETVRFLFLIQPARPEAEAQRNRAAPAQPAAKSAVSGRPGPGRSSQAGPGGSQGRPQRSLPLRLRQEIQEMPRRIGLDHAHVPCTPCLTGCQAASRSMAPSFREHFGQALRIPL